MRTFFTDAERWNWYGAGDETLAPRAAAQPLPANAPARVFWEMGLVFAVPLVIAVLAYALPV